MRRFLISVIFAFCAVVLAVMLEGFNPVYLFAFTSFLVVVSIPVISSFGVWNAGEVFTAWKDPFSKEIRNSFNVSLKILEFQEKLFYISGITGLILGSVIVLYSMKTNQSPDKAYFGLAASLTCPLYGLIFVTVLRIMRARIENIMNK
jgi:hypothetical protein